MLTNGDTFGLTVLAILVEEFGAEIIGADPNLVFSYVQDNWSIELHTELENKWNAIHTALVTQTYLTDPGIFDATCQTLVSGDTGLLDTAFEPAGVYDLMWGIFELELADGDTFDPSPAVQGYVEKIFDDFINSLEPGDGESPLQEYIIRFEEDKLRLMNQLERAGFQNGAALEDVTPWFNRR